MCVAATPDRSVVVRVGGEALLPGECAASPRARGGQIRVVAEDGRGGAARARWVGVRRGTTARVEVTREGRLLRRGRERCSGQVEEDMSSETGSSR